MKGILDSTFIWLENHKRQISHQNISCSRWFSVDWSRCAMSMYRGRTTRAQQRLTLTSVWMNEWMNEWSDEWSDEIDGPWSVAMRKCASQDVVKCSMTIAGSLVLYWHERLLSQAGTNCAYTSAFSSSSFECASQLAIHGFLQRDFY